MAKQIVETLIDDVNGEEASETVVFALDGSSYEIDLTDANAKTLRDALSPFVTHARRTSTAGQRRGGRPSGARPMSRARSMEIRQWAKEHGLPVSERGRIAATIVEQYDTAHR
ncbi:Lsr2 family protein [Nonomuraea sp. NPDC049637]|uniref:histone-like nucleoid-structuring protein Lsr2 n=1 Tax=Nonomuraea sp. NPDC049637 TaxID=3154356 RepID=UPI00341F92F3